MATLSQADSRNLYSWWWNSHITPKNSKWLQENLTDMDINVKAMIKLIEEDADSFARRAEMYYKKRPELMKLVEEFYRAYRALAERYDHATGVLRQAHRTIAEAFPNQIPFVLSDESPSGSSGTEVEPHTPEMPPPVRALFDPDDLQKDALGVSSHFHSIKRNGTYSEESDAFMKQKGLKQLNEMFATVEGGAPAKFAEERVRKGLNFQEEEGKGPEYKTHNEVGDLQKHKSGEKEDSSNETRSQGEVSQLSNENHNLKTRVTLESERAVKAETEIQNLKDALSELVSEKEAALLNYQLALERISNLEIEFSRAQEDLRKLNGEMLMGVAKLNNAEERCVLLEKANQSLQLELDTLEQKAKMQHQELNQKQEELEKLNISIQDEHQRYMQAKEALLSLEKLHTQSQEEARLLAFEIQSGAEMLKEMKLRKVELEEEVCHLKEEKIDLNEEYQLSTLKIKNLQDEVISLKEMKGKLEDQVGLHVEEIKVLQQELNCLTEERNDIDRRYHGLTEQMEVVSLNAESLQASVKELQDGNVELRQICKKHENEKVSLLENLKSMENILEKNKVLENSLSDANAETEGLREQIKTLEGFCESLHAQTSIHITEKAVLGSQVETITQNMEQLSEKNTFLENSLSDANVELEGLREKLKDLEVSYQSLYDEKSNVLAEKGTLVFQVERISQSLEKLESMHAELEEKHSDLAMEKELTHHQVIELQDSFKLEKQEHETLVQSSKSQVATLRNQISILQEEGRLREEEFEAEENKIMNAEVDILIFQRCVCDMKERNFILFAEFQKLQEASICAEKLISELKEESLKEKDKVVSLLEHNGNLRKGIHVLLKALNINMDCGSSDRIKDEALLQLILREFRDMKDSISDSHDENQKMLLEISVIFTLLKQYGLDVADLKAQKIALEQEFEIRSEELSVLQAKKHELLEMNEQLRQDVQASGQREKLLKAEMQNLCGQLSDLQENHLKLQNEICKCHEENQSLSKNFYDLMEKKDELEEENSAILAEAMTVELLYLIFKSCSAERVLEVKAIINDLDCLRGVNNGLEQEMRVIAERGGELEIENMHLKESVVNLEECISRLMILEDDLNTARNFNEQLNHQIITEKGLLIEKGTELSEVNQKLQLTQDKNTELCRILEGLEMEIDGAKVVREELEKKIFMLSEDNSQRDKEIAHVLEANEVLIREVEELRTREEQLSSELQKGKNEVKHCEVEIATLLNDIQISTVNAALFEEKVLELLVECESLETSAMIQREMLNEEITSRNGYVNELKKKLNDLEGENRGLKSDLNAYVPLVFSFRGSIASLEEHILSLTKHHASDDQEIQDNLLVSHQHDKNSQGLTENHRATAPAGVLELQKLNAKVETLQEVVMNIVSLLEQEKFNANTNLDASMKEIEGINVKGSSGPGEEQISKDSIMQLVEEGEEPVTTHNLQKDEAEISKVKCGQMMKDIQLDHGSYGPSRVENAETEDQMLELWETAESDNKNQAQKASAATEHDIEYHQIEEREEEKSEYPSSELVAEKELSVDKLETSKKVTESHQEWNKRLIERLASDAKRLSALQVSVQELKMKMEKYENNNHPKSVEYDTVKSQLKESELAIFQVIDINSELTKKAEDSSASPSGMVGEQEERQISEHAQRGSEKIGRLELELQKIHYILLKLEEGHQNNRNRAAERSPRVLLRDYLYGRKEGKKKRRFCMCVKPKTEGD